MVDVVNKTLVAIACGGTGGHLFPGLAVANELKQQGCDALLLVSSKAIDQQALQQASGVSVATLPAVGLSRGKLLRFLAGFGQSYLTARKLFRWRRPQAVLAMGGFTSAPPVLARSVCRAMAFLHESNSVPGRANRWLARRVDQAYVGFAQAAARLRCRDIVQTGTPVRPELRQVDCAASRTALGLEPRHPVLLVTGGSQGARAINQLMLGLLPRLMAAMPELQFLHLTGPHDETQVQAAYARYPVKAVVHAFLPEMPLALNAATAAISRAGASSLAELAAVRLPALLIPYPSAADDHQWHNADAFAETGAARALRQSEATPDGVLRELLPLLRDDSRRQTMRSALARQDAPQAAQRIVEHMLARLRAPGRLNARQPESNAEPSARPHRTESVFA